MIIISHDRHFLNRVCTHMADMDFGTLRVYPGNYDDYMLASAQARSQQMSDNAKAKDKIAELQDFVRRFSANKSKARQATSRQRQLEKIEVADIKPSSRQNPSPPWLIPRIGISMPLGFQPLLFDDIGHLVGRASGHAAELHDISGRYHFEHLLY